MLSSLKRSDYNLRPESSFPTSSRNINSVESNIITKIDNIVTSLKDLEASFSKIKEELLKKNTIEGRENNKICAVQGKVVSNQKKYYKNLEDDIDLLSRAFKDQFARMSSDLVALQSISKGKTEVQSGSSGEHLIGAVYPEFDPVHASIKCPEIQTIKVIKNDEIRPLTTSQQKEKKTMVPYTLKVSPPQTGKAVKMPNQIEAIRERIIGKPRSFTHTPARMAQGNALMIDSSPVMSRDLPLSEGILGLESKGESPQDYSANSLSDSLDSNQDAQDDDIFDMNNKSRGYGSRIEDGDKYWMESQIDIRF